MTNQTNKDILESFLPKLAVEDVVKIIEENNICFKIVNPRKRVLGTCSRTKNIITINSNLNQYSFLLVSLHEFAHFFAIKKYGNKIMPHGKQWKQEYSNILKQFLYKKVFPKELAEVVFSQIIKPRATFPQEFSKAVDNLS